MNLEYTELNNVSNIIHINATEGEQFDRKVLFGTAQLGDLAIISKAHPYSEDSPDGVQRIEKLQRAKKVHEYFMNNKHIRGCLPIVLSARNVPENVLIRDENGNIKQIIWNNDFDISRLDGNHRLRYADGKNPKYQKITENVQFVMYLDLSIDEERRLFIDLNANQVNVDKSLLYKMHAATSSNDSLYNEYPVEWIVDKLNSDEDSPLNEMIHSGNDKSDQKPLGRSMVIHAITEALKLNNFLYDRINKKSDLFDPAEVYLHVKNAYKAIKTVWNDDWILSLAKSTNSASKAHKKRITIFKSGSFYVLTGVAIRLQSDYHLDTVQDLTFKLHAVGNIYTTGADTTKTSIKPRTTQWKYIRSMVSTVLSKIR